MTDPDELTDALVTASRALVGIAVRSIQEAAPDLTVLQHRVLVLLAAHGSLTIGEVADALGVNASNATRHCDRLERMGLLERRRSEVDRRVVEARVTPQGMQVLGEVTRRRRVAVARVLEGMELPDRRATVAALDAFSAAADERADGSWAVPSW